MYVTCEVNYLIQCKTVVKYRKNSKNHNTNCHKISYLQAQWPKPWGKPPGPPLDAVA